MKNRVCSNIKSKLKSRLFFFERILYKFFFVKKLPRISLYHVKCFRLKNSDRVLIVMEGEVAYSGRGTLRELIVCSGENHFRSLVLYPENISANHRVFSFSHFVTARQSLEKIDIGLKNSGNIIFSHHLKHQEVLPFPEAINTRLFMDLEMLKRSGPNSDELKTHKQFSTGPLKVFMVSHNLNIEGAPKVLFEIAKGLSRKEGFVPAILASSAGMLNPAIEKSNIPVILFSEQNPDFYQGLKKNKSVTTRNPSLFELLASEKPDLVFANTIENYEVVNICDFLNIPVVWMIHESMHYSPQQLNFEDPDLGELYKAFMRASAVLFCSNHTMELYQNLNINNNFIAVPNAIADTEIRRIDKEKTQSEARRKLNIPEDAIVLLNVGVINQNKNQGLIIQALQHVKSDKSMLFIVGARPGYSYQEQLSDLVIMKGLDSRVTMIGLQADISEYYHAADIFVFPSISESYPLAILEAMMHGLPILATKAFGVNEQVVFGENALTISPDDEIDLAQKIERLSEDVELRKKMGASSRNLFMKMPAIDDMINTHAEVILSAFNAYNQNPKPIKNA